MQHSLKWWFDAFEILSNVQQCHFPSEKQSRKENKNPRRLRLSYRTCRNSAPSHHCPSSRTSDLQTAGLSNPRVHLHIKCMAIILRCKSKEGETQKFTSSRIQIQCAREQVPYSVLLPSEECITSKLPCKAIMQKGKEILQKPGTWEFK